MEIEKRRQIIQELEKEKFEKDLQLSKELGFDTVEEMEIELEIETLISRAAELGVTLLRVHNGSKGS
jgi:hypothetical protein